MMSFSDFPPPDHFPAFMPHQSVLKYFKMYAEKLNLLEYIHFKTSVVAVRKAKDYETSGRWEVSVRSGENDPIATKTFDGVMTCTGHHTYPHMPHFPGIDQFGGKVMHSHAFRRNNTFTGQRVVVVGIGNSAVDIAVDISHVASQVYLSTRRGAWVVSRRGPWGLPADAIANNRFLFKLHLCILQWIVETISNYEFDHEAYGIKPDHRALESHPTINDELPTSIITGKVRIMPNIKEFDQNGIVFEDGTYESIDAVIFATGYKYKLDFIDESVTCIKNNQPNLYKYVFPPHFRQATLAVIGLVQAVGALLPVSEIQCRWYTMLMSGKIKLPTKDEMILDIQKKKDAMSVYYPSQRHTVQVLWIEYMDEIAKIIGVRPNLYKLFWQKPSLAIRCLFGPCVPAQYRLVGYGQWDGAEAAIVNAVDRMKHPTRSCSMPKDCAMKSKKTVSLFQRFAWFLVLFVCVFNMLILYLYIL